MTTQPIHYQSIKEIQDSYENKSETPVSVTEHFLKRIESLDPDLKSYATVMSDNALQQAEFLSKLYDDDRKKLSLFGIPVAVKDLSYLPVAANLVSRSSKSKYLFLTAVLVKLSLNSYSSSLA